MAFRVVLARLFGVLCGVGMMPVRQMRMMPGRVVLAGAVMLGSLPMMLGCMLVVLGSLLVVMRQLCRVHDVSFRARSSIHQYPFMVTGFGRFDDPSAACPHGAKQDRPGQPNVSHSITWCSESTPRLSIFV
jgi:hypothetical protein